MTGSVYLSKGATTVYLTMTEISEEGAKSLTVLERGLSKAKQATSGAVVTIADFKKQTKRYFVNGNIIPAGGSTAWQQKDDLRNIIEAGGTMQFTNGSDGTFTGNVSKWKFLERGAEINKYEASIEFICGSSR